jgi:hypothetical protein
MRKPTSPRKKAGHNEEPPNNGHGPKLPLDNDLVLRDENGHYYWIPEAAIHASRLPEDAALKRMTDQMENLIKQGVIMADVPQRSMPGVGCACYFFNLGAIRRASVKPRKAGATLQRKDQLLSLPEKK